ncbi:MAG: anti-sigma factor [Dehalococcoidia bacterium]
MDCREVEELIEAHALGALEADEREQVDAHLADCGDCRVQYEESLRVAQSLALSVPIVAAPPDLFHRTMADVHRDLAMAAGVEEKVRWYNSGWSRRLAPLSAAAASLVAIAALGFSLSANNRVDDIDDRSAAQGEPDAQVMSALQEQQLFTLALAAEDRRELDLNPASSDVEPEPEPEPDATPEEVRAAYLWAASEGVGVLLISGLVAGAVYTACIETEDLGVRAGGLMQVFTNGSANKAFLLEPGDPMIALGITESENCEADSSAWTHHWEIR